MKSKELSIIAVIILLVLISPLPVIIHHLGQKYDLLQPVLVLSVPLAAIFFVGILRLGERLEPHKRKAYFRRDFYNLAWLNVFFCGFVLGGFVGFSLLEPAITTIIALGFYLIACILLKQHNHHAATLSFNNGNWRVLAIVLLSLVATFLIPLFQKSSLDIQQLAILGISISRKQVAIGGIASCISGCSLAGYLYIAKGLQDVKWDSFQVFSLSPIVFVLVSIVMYLLNFSHNQDVILTSSNLYSDPGIALMVFSLAGIGTVLYFSRGKYVKKYLYPAISFLPIIVFCVQFLPYDSLNPLPFYLSRYSLLAASIFTILAIYISITTCKKRAL